MLSHKLLHLLQMSSFKSQGLDPGTTSFLNFGIRESVFVHDFLQNVQIIPLGRWIKKFIRKTMRV